MSDESETKSGLTLVVQPQDYFRELVSSAIGNQHVATRPETEFYLVDLLNKFMITDRLFSRDAQGNLREEPLALMIKQALEEEQAEAQRLLFRHVGDVSLYIAGFFQDSLNRKLVDVDYYIDMGGTAYKQAALRADEKLFRSLFSELAEKFGTFVEVLAEVSDKTAQKSEKDILRIYENWVRTRSERAAKALKEAGIIPNDTIKKDWQ